MKLTLNLHELAALLPLSAEHDVRYYLNGVHLEVTTEAAFAVVTDGHVLGALRIARTDEWEGTGSVIIPRALLERVKVTRKLPIGTLTHEPGEKEDPGRVCITYLGAEYADHAVSGRFPDWRRVVPAKCSGEAAYFNPELPARFAAVAGKFTGARSAGHKVWIVPNGSSGALVHIECGQQFVGVVMPMRPAVGAKDDPTPKGAPAWVNPRAELKAAA